jgi:hypothetical protein
MPLIVQCILLMTLGKKYSAQLDVQGNIITSTLDLSNVSVGKAVILQPYRILI